MERMRRLDLGAFLLGLIILGIGTYYLLANTFGLDLPELDWEMVWPLFVIALGAGLLWGAWSRMSRGGQGPQGV